MPVTKRVPVDPEERIRFTETLPLLIVHLGCLGAIWTGVSRAAIVALVITYTLRVFALTAGYHRYFSHNAYRTSRAFQFILALLGASAAQLGPLWWAAHHRRHHLTADTADDLHSPSQRGFFWAHLGWLMCRKYRATDFSRVPDFAKYPELRFLDRFSYLAPLGLAALLFVIGNQLARLHPELGVSGLQLVVWGFCISTVLVYHVTFSINSLMHIFGTRRFATPDTSRNNFVLALLSFGEGWHNNHHRYAVAARQGLAWWELDLTYYLLKLLALFRIIWDVREPPAALLAEVRG
jgi:stearoyl-CoA desaturase (delta-9 desaturase)